MLRYELAVFPLSARSPGPRILLMPVSGGGDRRCDPVYGIIERLGPAALP